MPVATEISRPGVGFPAIAREGDAAREQHREHVGEAGAEGHVQPAQSVRARQPDWPRVALRGEQLRAYRTTFDPPSGSMHVFMTPLVLERGRLTAPTLMRIVPTLHPKHHVRITSELLERGCEEMPAEGEKAEGGV